LHVIKSKKVQGKNAENPIKSVRRLASSKKYISPNQLTLDGFETPFEHQLTAENRWVKLSRLLPWDSIVSLYDKQFTSKEGRPPINGRIVIGAVIIKHMLNLSDRETISQIQENMFMQYFLGYSSFTNEPPFDASLFVDIRERLNLSITTAISEIIVAHHFEKTHKQDPVTKSDSEHTDDSPKNQEKEFAENDSIEKCEKKTHKGTLLMDATVAPQNVTFPTDLKVLNSAREKSEEIIDRLYNREIHPLEKPRTYRRIARKEFLLTAKKKNKSSKELTEANAKQLRYLKRNIGHIEELLSVYENDIRKTPIKENLMDYYATIKKVYEQQQYMLDNGVHSVSDRIVNIHQPHVRPIVRGKEGKKVEFGSKIQLALISGFSFIDKLDWNNFNEGTCLKKTIENYFKRFRCYPEKVLADKIYCTRENRAYLKELGIRLEAKPLGRPSKEAMSNHVSPGERNPVEGKFGQAKIAYGMNNIMAKLKTTSESWIGSIVLVLNLVKLAGQIPLWIKLILLTFEKKWLLRPINPVFV
jgi:transposase, IS5 family